MQTIVYGDISGLPESMIKALALRKQGMAFASIVEELGLSIGATGLINRFRRYGISVKFQGVCALPECHTSFETTDQRKLYCSPLHSKRGSERTRVGKVTEYRPCRLPECGAQVLCVNVDSPTSRRFCSRGHCNKFDGRRAINYYHKLVDKTACEGCGWWGPGLQQHHIHAQADGGGDAPENLAWLCPNCHCLVHAGLATFSAERVFDDNRQQAHEAEILRREAWGEDIYQEWN